MFLTKLLFVALVSVAQADDAHWLCQAVPSNEWTSHYCTRLLGPRDQTGVNYITGVSTAEEDDASIDEQTYEHLENHDVESVTDFNEAMLILNMPDELRVDISQLHIFSNPPSVDYVEKHTIADDNVYISAATSHDHVCGETHSECSTDAPEPCGPACCANPDCACAKATLAGQSCCACSSVVQAFVHEKRFHYVTQDTCTQVYVTKVEESPTDTIFFKHHVELTASECNSLRH